RYVHSYIQCTHNKVMPRFYAFAASSLTLLLMWVLFAIDQIGKVIAIY
ncbi:MAG: MAPEG family protein, partial [Limnohabitans sp.]